MRVFRVRAINTALESDNRIHADVTAVAYGFRGGLVPGVTVYGYMAEPVIQYFGEQWLHRGAMTVRFKQPVYDGEEVRIEARETDGKRLAVTVEQDRAEGVAWICDEPPQPPARQWTNAPAPARENRRPASVDVFRPGAVLGSIAVQVNLAAAQVSRPLPAVIGESRCAHPAVLLSLANDLLIHNVVLGPWIHVSSEVTNFAAVHDGEFVTVRGNIAANFERKATSLRRLMWLSTGQAARRCGRLTQ